MSLKRPEDGLQAYIVGGYVRDQLLGLRAKDRDWVVVGTSANEMLQRGFKQVGKDFPVFLHPQTQEEYALARTERKTGRGYKGFAFNANPEVTLEQDLQRRDLTINAMALSPDGQIIDPLGGQTDLHQHILRHAGPAFAEDPLRVLRLARFAAQLDFKVAPETHKLCCDMAASGELQSLVPERIWQELQRAMAGSRPRRFIEELRNCHALKILFPEIDALFGIPQPSKYHPEIDTGLHVLMALDQVTQMSNDPQLRFAVLTHDLGKAATPKQHWPSHRGHEALGVTLVDQLCQRYLVPKNYRRLARKTARYHLMVHIAFDLKPKTLLKLLEDLDAYRQPEDFERFLVACKADIRGRKGLEHKPYPQADFMRRIYGATRKLSAKDIPGNIQGAEIGAAIRHLRTQTIASIKKMEQPSSLG